MRDLNYHGGSDLKGNFALNACLTYSSDPWVMFNMVVLTFFKNTHFCQFWVVGIHRIDLVYNGAYAVLC